jgi:hypothetical protein
MSKHNTQYPMTKSSRALAREALTLAQQTLPAYSSARSRKDYTTHQLFAILALKTFLKTDYRGVVQHLADYSDIRNDLALTRVPHFTTLQKAAGRLLKKGRSSSSSNGPPRPHAIAA